MLKSLQDFLHSHIPLTKDMGLQLHAYNEISITSSAPLSPNINDKGSVFGGSSSALMIISAWSLIKIHCELNNINADIVIHENNTQWHKPLYQDLFCEASFSQNYNFQIIKMQIKENRHFRVRCNINLVDASDNIYCTMIANFVVIPKREE